VDSPFQVQNWILAIINFDHVGHINVILPRLQVSLCLATILLLTCSHFHLQWPFLTSWMASLVEMRPRCNIINQTPCCPSPILTTSKLLGQGFEAAWSGARGGVNLALEQLEEDLAGRSLITARYRWSRLTPWFYAWQLLARPCGLSFPGLKSCSAQRLSLFKLCGHSSRAGWRDWLTACRDVMTLICQVWQFRLPLKLPRGPCPPPLHVTEGVKEPRKKMKLLMKL